MAPRLVRESVKKVLGNGSLINVIAEADNCDIALGILAKTKPDMVLLGIEAGNTSALDRLAEIKTTSPHSRILVLAEKKDENNDECALINGAHGLVVRNGAPEMILKAVRKVHDGEVWFGRKMIGRILDETCTGHLDPNNQKEKINSLTKRELEIARLIGTGMVNRRIASQLDISEKTVRNHLTTIYSKLGVSNRLELAIFASKYRLIGNKMSQPQPRTFPQN
mgnify:FL=1